MARLGTGSARFGVLLGPLALALTLAGCGATGSSNTTTSVTATGSTLTVFLSDPPAVKASQALQDVVRGEQLAWTEHLGSVKNIALRLVRGSASAPQNAREAIGQNSLVGYLGEIQPGQSRQTVGILNAEDVLELSPTDPVTPSRNDFEDISTYGRTFGSLATDLGSAPSALESAATGFRASFTRTFSHAPAAGAVQGYDAVWVLLRVLSALKGQANNRTKIAASVIATLRANRGQTSVPAFTIVLK